MNYFQVNTKSDFLASLKRAPVILLLCVAVALVATAPTSVHAQEWRFEPVVRVGAEYDDNARLDIRTDEEVTLEGYLANLEAIVSYSSDRTAFVFQPSVLISKYPDESLYDAENYYLRSVFSRDTRAGTFGFRATYAQEDVRRAERAISDLDDGAPRKLPMTIPVGFCCLVIALNCE